MSEEIFEESSEETSQQFSEPGEISAESPESEDIVEEHFDDLNCLVEKGDHEAVKSFIEENNVKPGTIYRDFELCIGYNYNRLCPVGLAAKCGHVQVMKTLVNAGFRVNERSAYFDIIRPIHLACERGNLEVVKTLVEEYNVDITHEDNCKSTPAMCIVAERGDLEIVQYFIEKAQIPVNSRYGENKYSALHAAAERDRIDVCNYLISKGADINIGDVFNHTPLMLAAQYASFNLAHVLLDAEADVNILDDGQETAFFKAAYSCNLEMMKLLQTRGADPELYGSFSNSPLYNAVSDNRIDIVFYLVNELNVRIESIKYYQDTGPKSRESVCRMALLERHFDMVKLLFNAGYDPSQELAEYEDSDEDNNSEDNNSTGSSDDSGSILPLKKRKCFLEPGDKVKLRELREMIARPRSLLALSVLTVRRLLGRRLPKVLKRLPLPDIMKNVIVTCGEVKP